MRTYGGNKIIALMMRRLDEDKQMNLDLGFASIEFLC